MKSKILLTGASGFVGRHVIDELGSDYELHAVSTSTQQLPGIEKQFHWDKLHDVNDSYLAVIHLAGLAHDTSSSAGEQAYFDVNQGLTRKLLDHCIQLHPKTFIYLSSVKAVVDSTSDTIVTEETPSSATNVYGRSKLAAEKEVAKAELKATKICLRPVMIYGKGQKGNLTTLEKLIHRGIPFPFKYWKNQRSVLFITNLTKVLRRLVETPIASGTYFVADDEATSTVGLLKYIGEGMRKKPRFVPVPNGLIRFLRSLLPQKVKHTADKILGSLEVDNNKLKSELGITQMPFATQQGFVLTYSKS
ncbi:MAG: NAD-dependent epimerase/dehydratase family protein [Bacteroidia bacterium]|nr:NAD-dependent epimerase/dehydratase family protein [Bacteroidia bacterium]